jgi:hypothetical protein
MICRLAPPVCGGGVTRLHDSLNQPAECALPSVRNRQTDVKSTHQEMGQIFNPCRSASGCPHHADIGLVWTWRKPE